MKTLLKEMSMATTYEVYHRDEWIPATFVRDADDDRVFLSYMHVEDDEDGEPKEAVERTTNFLKSEVRITE